MRARALWGTCRSSSCCFGRIGEQRCRKCEINASSNFAGRTMRFIHEFMDSRNKTDGITEECIIYASSSAFAAASLSCCQCHAALPFSLTCHAAPFFPSPRSTGPNASYRILKLRVLYNSKLILPELKFNFTNPVTGYSYAPEIQFIETILEQSLTFKNNLLF